MLDTFHTQEYLDFIFVWFVLVWVEALKIEHVVLCTVCTEAQIYLACGKNGGMTIGWCSSNLFLWSREKESMFSSLHPRSNNKLPDTNHFLKRQNKKMLICVGSVFANWKAADGNLFSSHVYCDVSACELKHKQSETDNGSEI